MEGRGPGKSAVGLQLGAEEWVGERGEVVVVDAGVEKGCFREEGGEGADVGFDGVF